MNAAKGFMAKAKRFEKTYDTSLGNAVWDKTGLGFMLR